MADTAFRVLRPGDPGGAGGAAAQVPVPLASAAGAGAGPAAELLADLVRRITGSLDLRETLQVVADAVVDNLGFGVAVVNLIRPDDMCQAVAVAGSAEAAEALLGTSAPADSIRKILAACEPWGELRFLDHRHDDGVTRPVATWTPDMKQGDEPDSWHPDDILLAPLHGPDGALIGMLSVDLPRAGRLPDLPHRRLLEQFAAHAALAIEHSRVHTRMSDSEQLFRAMFDRSPIAIALMTEDRRITRVNPACVRLLGRDAAELNGHQARELDRPGPVPGRRGADADSSGPGQYEVHFTRPDGSEIWGRVNSTPLEPESRGGPRLILTQVEDITQLRTMQARFAHAATHDQLTGLANRTLVLRRLTEALTEARHSGQRIAVLYCDVDHFKRINDTLGHAAGDQLLIEIARRLAQTARSLDVAGRFGGDEFVLAACPVPTAEEAAGLAERVLRAVCRSVRLDSGPLLPSLSVGAALSNATDTADTLIAAADQALYGAKAAGRGRWQLAPDR